MTVQDFFKVIRTRWIVVCISLTLGVLAAVAVNLTTTPLYQASTRLFVSTSSGSSASEIYQGNRFSQERVVSYTELLMGETLARRTIDKLGLDMRAEELRSRVKASSKNDTVLIDVKVVDPSPVRARDIADALSDEFVEMVRELETPPDGTMPDARVVVEQRASVPSSPVVPQTNRNIFFGLIIGLLTGVGLAILLDLLDNTVKDRETIEDITGVGLVGSIPLDKERRKEPAISFESDNSPIAEGFRKLRTNLQFLAVDNPPRAILITSSLAAEGKSTTAINVALALAEANHNVILVDGDLRRPRLDKYLDVVGAVGLSSVLAGGVNLEDVIQKTRFQGLSVLTSGPVPPNPSELLGSLAARNTIQELRNNFDYVIVDSSPLLAVTDAAVLAANVDGVLIIARFSQTKRDQLAHAVASLESVGAPLLGAVLSMTPARGDSSYSYMYGYYGERNQAEPRSHGSGHSNDSPE